MPAVPLHGTYGARDALRPVSHDFWDDALARTHSPPRIGPLRAVHAAGMLGSMIDPSTLSLVSLAAFADVFKTVIGVLLALAGLGLTVMGGIALADRSVKSGAGALLIGLALLAGGLWLVGALPV